MGALENIKGRIKKDAQVKGKQHVDGANEEAQKLLAVAKKELGKEKNTLDFETEKAIKIQRSRAISEAKLEARKTVLRAKEYVISQAFEMANQRLRNIGPSENERFLRGAITSGVNLLGREAVVLCNSRDSSMVTRIASELGPGISVSSEGIRYLGGVVVRAKDGSAQIDVTFEGVLERMKNDLRKEVAEILFKEKSETKEE
jgi:V/A-type H+-transporting ATPase subunit E